MKFRYIVFALALTVEPILGKGKGSLREGKGSPSKGKRKGTPSKGEGKGSLPKGEGKGSPPEGKGNGSPQKRDVCVVGAGAAGITAAFFLEERGHSVTVFEKLNRIGGMCCTPKFEEQPVDTGAVFVTADYNVTKFFINKFEEPLKKISKGFLLDYTTKSGVPLSALVSDPNALMTGINAYLTLISQYPELTTPGFYTDTQTPLELSLPFATWLEQRSLSGLIPIFEIPISRFGYGLMTEIPALYAIKYMNPLNTMALVAAASGVPDQKVVGLLVNGYQNLIEKIAMVLKDVRVNVDILKIRRPEGKNSMDQTSKLVYRDNNGKNEEVQCGAIIAAFAQKSSVMGFMGLDDTESVIFDKTFTQNYYSAAVRVKDEDVETYVTYYNAFNSSIGQLRPPYPDWDGHVLTFTNVLENDWGRLQQYALPNTTKSDEEVREYIDTDLAAFGEIEVQNWTHWSYFPSVSPEDIQNGFYKDLEGIQGYRNTYYTGGLLNFENVEGVMRYSKELVETHF